MVYLHWKIRDVLSFFFLNNKCMLFCHLIVPQIEYTICDLVERNKGGDIEISKGWQRI